jgi:hypothetical protein
MNRADVQPEAGVRSASSSTVDTRLRGGWLILARVVWVAVVVLALGLFIASIPTTFASLHMLCTDASCSNGGQLTADSVRELQALGLSMDFYATYIVVFIIVFTFGYFAVGAMLIWRKSDNRMALFASLTLVTFPMAFTEVMATLPASWWLPVQFVGFLGSICIVLFFYLFPNGQFVPRWMRWLSIGVIVYWGAKNFFPFSPLNPFTRFPTLNDLTFLGFVGTMVVGQIYRYRRVSSLLQRQQTKWVVFGMSVAIGCYVGLVLLYGVFSLPPKGPFADLIIFTATYFLILLIPFSIVFAILRARLWDIDILINRTLVYATLTATLALIYFGLIFGLQSLMRGLIGQAGDDPLVIVISTLAIAVLFQPLRHRLQRVIDRRFFRRKYDAAQTLAAFSATLRHEVDLEQLREELRVVVEETMQPAHVSLWLCQPHQEGTYKTKAWVSNGLVSPHEE